MANEIMNKILTEGHGLLSKIQIGGKVYELKDKVARQEIEALIAAAVNYYTKAEAAADYEALSDAIEESKYDDSALKALIQALEQNKADKTQVATDIADAVAAEAAIARAAEEKNAEDIIAINAILNTVDSEDAITSLKELAIWVEQHGGEAAEMTKSIEANAKAIEDMDKAYKEADSNLSERISSLEDKFDGEDSVAELIATAKQEAIDAAAKDASDKDAVVTKAFQDADKAITDSLGALAHKDSASGKVAGQTISGVKANGTTTGSITVALEATEKDVASTGKYTPAGNVTGTVATDGSIEVTAKYTSAEATLAKGDYTPAGSVSVALSGATFNAITGVGTQAQFTEGEFTPASITKEDVTANYAKEGIVGSVDEDECLVFTAAGIEAITATKVTAFDGGAKAKDTFVANSLPTMAEQNVGVQSATFSGTKAENALVTGVSYQKADIDQATFTGKTVDIAATFAGTEGDVAVAGKCHDYAVKTAEFTGAAIELNVGDIVVTEKTVTVE